MSAQQSSEPPQHEESTAALNYGCGELRVHVIASGRLGGAAFKSSVLPALLAKCGELFREHFWPALITDPHGLGPKRKDGARNFECEQVKLNVGAWRFSFIVSLSHEYDSPSEERIEACLDLYFIMPLLEQMVVLLTHLLTIEHSRRKSSAGHSAISLATARPAALSDRPVVTRPTLALVATSEPRTGTLSGQIDQGPAEPGLGLDLIGYAPEAANDKPKRPAE
ncbi:MAG TPA: hypothetical protein VLI05_06825 [Candidatus Saccharimonadia bacterium]|nr:hypothetical protein [Candidatus Saccharimonadia bacterium]